MTVRILTGDSRDVLLSLDAGSVHCCVTSPPYFGLRDYGCDGQIGLEQTPAEYVEQLVAVFREVRRVLRDDGTLWLNLGDSYAGSRCGGDTGSSTLRNPGQRVDESARAKRSMTASRRRDDEPIPRSDLRIEGLKPKDLMGMPWRVAFALQTDGWWLRQDIVWSKPNPMPESVRDRCTKAHEYVFLLSKSERYHFDADSIAEPADEPRGPGNVKPVRSLPGERGTSDNANVRGSLHKIGARETRNKRSVWNITTQPFSEAHFATMPPELAETCIKAGCPEGGTVLDPFGGAGTTGLAADRLQRSAVLVELNPEYTAIAKRRIHGDAPLFANVQTEEAA